MDIKKTLRRHFRYPLKELKKDGRLYLGAAVAALAGSLFASGLTLNERRQLRETVAEQREAIRRLTEENAGDVNDLSDPVKKSEGNKPEPAVPVSSAAPVSVNEDYENFKNRYIYNLSYDCQMSRDWVTVRPRYDCTEANHLLDLIDLMKSRCREAAGLVKSPEEKHDLEKSESILKDLGENPRIAKRQCRNLRKKTINPGPK